MLINRICLCYFSPCGNVKRIVDCLAKKMRGRWKLPVVSLDFTKPSIREDDVHFQESDFVIVATPVYAGRIPNKIMPYIKDKLTGNGCKSIAIVSFGNRNYDDALAEMTYLLEQNDFLVLGAAAIASEHSFSEDIGVGRPDEEDMSCIDALFNDIDKKLKADDLTPVHVPGTKPPVEYYTPLKQDGTPARFLKAVPKVNILKCSHCMECVKVCPMGAIDSNDIQKYVNTCIKCQACIKFCQQKARYFDDEDFISHVEMLKKNYVQRKSSEYFI